MAGSGLLLLPVTGASAFVSAFALLGELEVRSWRDVMTRATTVWTRTLCKVGALREDVGAQIPVMLDIVTLGLSAGLSFDASVELYCGRYQGVLSDTLGRERLRWQLGLETRSEGLRALGSSLGQPVFAELSNVVEESLELGLPLAGALEREASQLRAEQRARLEERIEQVPVRMIIPLGTLIVPAMLLAILGPLLGSAVGIG